MKSYDYTHRQGVRRISWEDFAALATDEFVVFPWDEQVYQDGRWQPHPEIVARLAAQEKAPLTPADLQAFMDAHAIPGEILHLSVPTPTVETAAQAVGCLAEQIVKSIRFLVDSQPVLAIASGTAYVERRAIAALYSVGRKRVKLASTEAVAAIAGYEVGSLPPFGHRQPLTTLLDRRVLDLTVAYAGGGAENALLRLDPRDILRITEARVMDLCSRAKVLG